MTTSFSAVVILGFLTATAAAVADDDGRRTAEIGVHHIEAKEPQSPLMRRQQESNPAAMVQPSHKNAAGTNTDAYKNAVLASKPVAYWKLGDLTGDKADADPDSPACGPDGTASGDPCAVRGSIHGIPTDPDAMLGADSLIYTQQTDKAMQFAGTSDNEIVIPDDEYININDTGYLERTVELWFKADSVSPDGDVIYEEGSANDGGINIYVKGDKLYMYAWDRGNNEANNAEYGTTLVATHPIECAIETGKIYYAAFVFCGGWCSIDDKARTASAYIKKPGSSNKVEACGTSMTLPAGARIPHHGESNSANVAYGGNAVIGGVKGSTRTSGTTLYNTQTGHNFVGTIDEVAIYNRALPVTELQKHVTAAGDWPETTAAASPAAASPASAA